jgi:hypothetical protein
MEIQAFGYLGIGSSNGGHAKPLGDPQRSNPRPSIPAK